MNSVERRLLAKAKKLFGDDITPCSRRSWAQCVTKLPDGRQALWFNDRNGSTHIVTLEPARVMA